MWAIGLFHQCAPVYFHVCSEEMCIWRERGTIFLGLDLFACKFRPSCYQVATKLDPLNIIKDSSCLTRLPTPIHKGVHKGGVAARCVVRAPSFMDGCGEAGEAQGVLNGPNFVATVSDLARKAQSKTHFSKIAFPPPSMGSFAF